MIHEKHIQIRKCKENKLQALKQVVTYQWIEVELKFLPSRLP